MECISVNTRLPKCDEQHNRIFSSGKVLVYADEGWEIDEYLQYFESTPNGFKLISQRWNNAEGVTHWMELPKDPSYKKATTYCIEITRELEDLMVEHTDFETPPTREDILKFVETLDCNYDDNYGKINYYKIN